MSPSFGKISEIIPKLDEKNRYYILGGLLLVISLVDYFLVMQPQLSTLRSLNPKITLLAGDIKTADLDAGCGARGQTKKIEYAEVNRGV